MGSLKAIGQVGKGSAVNAHGSPEAGCEGFSDTPSAGVATWRADRAIALLARPG